MILWMGEDFLLPDLSFYLLVAIGYINFSRPYDTFLIPYGRVEDIWAPITEAVLNLGFSILLGYYFSLPGILVGILISLVVIVLGWKGYFLATKGLEVPPFSIIFRYFGYTALFICISVLLVFLNSWLLKESIGERSFRTWCIMMSVQLLSFLMLSLLILVPFDINTRNLIHRVSVRLRHK